MPSLALILGPIQFNQPFWLSLLIPGVLLTLWIGRRSLSGLAGISRRVALVVRLLVIALLVGALADPQYRREAKVVAVTAVVDISRSLPTNIQALADSYLTQAAKSSARPGDLLGYVTTARDAAVQAIPQTLDRPIDVQFTGPTDATNLEQGVRLGLAVAAKDAANRLLLISDGQENSGSVLAAAQAAKAAGIPIDVVPMRYAYDREVVLDRLITPATARQGEVVNLRVVLTATQPTHGRLFIKMDGQPLELDPAHPGAGKVVELAAGTNVQTIPIAIPTSGAHEFSAVYEPLPDADGKMTAIFTENKRGLAVTFVGGEGRLLVLSAKPEEASQLMAALKEGKIKAELRDPAVGFTSLQDLSTYEGVVLVNCSAFEFNQQQQEELRAYVHDLGGGLVMIGGPDSFGAGGWIGSPLADALPIKLDPPQKRQMPRGALAMVMHACELPEGNYWSKRTAEAAVDALAAQDMAGILESGWNAGSAVWTHPLSTLGNKSEIKRAIKNMTLGDTSSFVDMLTMALSSLQKAPAGTKHVIIISDGDPQGPSDSLLQQFIASKITISTVAVFPHAYGNASSDLTKMKYIARVTGGKYHEVTTQAGLNSLPQIFIKEAQTVKRSLIWEGEAFSPKIVGGLADTLRGLSGVPPISGYVVGAEREGLAQVTLRGMENDPVMAQWQYGLGRTVAFTSDATSRWAAAWMPWPQYRSFWDQIIRWTMRPPGSPNIRVTTEDRGDKTHLVVEALDDKGERLNFLRWQGRLVRPDLTALDIDLRQVGPGRYEADIDSKAAGSYTLSLGYNQFVEGEGGTSDVKRGAVQAAITRPFADEFRTLRDNAPLLEQVARETGGRVLTGKPLIDEPWSREGLKIPVSLQPIWLIVTTVAIGVFLLDVGVRRVRVDLPAIAKSIAIAFGAAKQSTGQQIDSLKAAREKARERIAQSGTPGAPVQPGDGPSIPLAKPVDSKTRAAKFEASADELRAAKGQSAVTEAPRVGAPVKDKTESGSPAKPKDEEQGMSRLLKAKKRAQDEIDES